MNWNPNSNKPKAKAMEIADTADDKWDDAKESLEAGWGEVSAKSEKGWDSFSGSNEPIGCAKAWKVAILLLVMPFRWRQRNNLKIYPLYCGEVKQLSNKVQL